MAAVPASGAVVCVQSVWSSATWHGVFRSRVRGQGVPHEGDAHTLKYSASRYLIVNPLPSSWQRLESIPGLPSTTNGNRCGGCLLECGRLTTLVGFQSICWKPDAVRAILASRVRNRPLNF